MSIFTKLFGKKEQPKPVEVVVEKPVVAKKTPAKTPAKAPVKKTAPKKPSAKK